MKADTLQAYATYIEFDQSKLMKFFKKFKNSYRVQC